MMVSGCSMGAFAAYRKDDAEKTVGADAVHHRSEDDLSDEPAVALEDVNSANSKKTGGADQTKPIVKAGSTIYLSENGIPIQKDGSRYAGGRIVKGEGWEYDVDEKILTIRDEVTYCGDVKKISCKKVILKGGVALTTLYEGEVIVSGGTLDGGTFSKKVTYQSGTIAGGIFSEVKNADLSRFIPIVCKEDDLAQKVRIGGGESANWTKIKGGKAYWKVSDGYVWSLDVLIRLDSLEDVKSINGTNINLKALSKRGEMLAIQGAQIMAYEEDGACYLEVVKDARLGKLEKLELSGKKVGTDSI